MQDKESPSPKITPQLWSDLFWARIKEHTGLSGDEARIFAPPFDIVETMQEFANDPGRAADVQIANWRKKHSIVDQTFQDRSGDGSKET